MVRETRPNLASSKKSRGSRGHSSRQRAYVRKNDAAIRKSYNPPQMVSHEHEKSSPTPTVSSTFFQPFSLSFSAEPRCLSVRRSFLPNARMASIYHAPHTSTSHHPIHRPSTTDYWRLWFRRTSFPFSAVPVSSFLLKCTCFFFFQLTPDGKWSVTNLALTLFIGTNDPKCSTTVHRFHASSHNSLAVTCGFVLEKELRSVWWSSAEAMASAQKGVYGNRI